MSSNFASKQRTEYRVAGPLDVSKVDVLRGMLAASNDACWCMEFAKPVDLTTPDHEVVRQVFENGPVWRYCNAAMERLYQLPAGQDMNARPVHEIFPNNPSNQDFIHNLIVNGFEVDGAPALDRNYTGMEIYVENDVRAHISNGKLYRMFGTVRNVGKHRRREQALKDQLAAAEGMIAALPNPFLADWQASPLRTRFLAENRTRPDFVTQRRLAPDLNRLLVRGERAMLQGARILITGESGVGKSEIAKFLHSTVADADAPFVVVNCASSSDALFAKALFGDTGPQAGGIQQGLIEQSEGGTLFLDEVAEVPLSAQALLLRFLEDGLVTRAAGGLQRVANVRVIAATNRDLRQLVGDGRFRADLYYRLAVIPLRVPPLREMPTLIDHLINRFLQTINQRRQAPVLVSRRMRDTLADYSYPGNIRELLNIVQKLTIFTEETEDLVELLEDLLSPIDIQGIDGAPPSIGPASATYDLKTEIRRYERALIDKSIRIHGSKRKAASALGVDIGTIVRKTAERKLAKEAANNKTINIGVSKS